MSNTDSFIEEVTEEVRRDKLYAALRKYGWIGVVAVLALVGGVAYVSYQNDQARASAEALGDGMLAALQNEDSADRVTALQGVDGGAPAARAVLAFLTAAEQVNADQGAAAAATLLEIANAPDLPLIYRQVASYKALGANAAGLSVEERQAGYADLAAPGNPLRMLAEEQLALIDVEMGNSDAAIVRLQAILDDSEVTADLQQRVLQVMVALGAEPDLAQLTGQDN